MSRLHLPYRQFFQLASKTIILNLSCIKKILSAPNVLFIINGALYVCYFKFIILHITKMNELINDSAVGPEARFMCCLLVLMGFSFGLCDISLCSFSKLRIFIDSYRQHVLVCIDGQWLSQKSGHFRGSLIL